VAARRTAEEERIEPLDLLDTAFILALSRVKSLMANSAPHDEVDEAEAAVKIPRALVEEEGVLSLILGEIEAGCEKS